MSFGPTSTGFLLKSFADILAEIEADQLNDLSATANQSPTSVIGQLNNIVADQVAEGWEALQAVASGQDPNTATGQSLNYLLTLTGLTRLPAAATVADVSFVTNAAGTIPAGTVLSLATDPNVRFTLDADVVASGAGTFTGTVTCTETGPIIAIANDISVLENPVGIVDSVTNPANGTTGRNLETDEEARARRDSSVSTSGAGTADTLLARVSNLSDVAAARYFENRGSLPDANGLPGKSFELVVELAAGGDNDNVAQAIYGSAPAGIGIFGTNASGTATSATTGQEFTIPFTTVTEVDTKVTLSIDVDAAAYGDTTEAATAIREALVAYVDAIGAGQTLYASELNPILFGISGVRNVSSILLSRGVGSTPSLTSVSFNVREVPEVVTPASDIVINVTEL